MEQDKLIERAKIPTKKKNCANVFLNLLDVATAAESSGKLCRSLQKVVRS